MKSYKPPQIIHIIKYPNGSRFPRTKSKPPFRASTWTEQCQPGTILPSTPHRLIKVVRFNSSQSLSTLKIPDATIYFINRVTSGISASYYFTKQGLIRKISWDYEYMTQTHIYCYK